MAVGCATESVVWIEEVRLKFIGLRGNVWSSIADKRSDKSNDQLAKALFGLEDFHREINGKQNRGKECKRIWFGGFSQENQWKTKQRKGMQKKHLEWRKHESLSFGIL